jgi:hypothetical protein
MIIKVRQQSTHTPHMEQVVGLSLPRERGSFHEEQSNARALPRLC